MSRVHAEVWQVPAVPLFVVIPSVRFDVSRYVGGDVGKDSVGGHAEVCSDAVVACILQDQKFSHEQWRIYRKTSYRKAGGWVQTIRKESSISFGNGNSIHGSAMKLLSSELQSVSGSRRLRCVLVFADGFAKNQIFFNFIIFFVGYFVSSSALKFLHYEEPPVG